MKLTSPEGITAIEFQENVVEVVIIEAPQILSLFVLEIQKQIEGKEGRWLLYDKGEPIEISKNCALLLNPFSVSINEKKILNALYAEIEKEVQETEILLEWNKVLPFLSQTMEKITEEVEYSLSYTQELQIKDFLKYMNLKFLEQEETFLETFLEYLKLAHKVLKIKIFILVNIKSFLSQEQLHFLYQQSQYEKYQLLLLEGFYREERLEGERVTIIDKDSCVIQLDMQ